jgi:hypothetical protein
MLCDALIVCEDAEDTTASSSNTRSPAESTPSTMQGDFRRRGLSPDSSRLSSNASLILTVVEPNSVRQVRGFGFAVALHLLTSSVEFRRGFAPSDFQTVPLLTLVETPFEDLLSFGTPLDQYDPEIIRDQGSTVFLREGSRDYSLKSFLGILVSTVPFPKPVCVADMLIRQPTYSR